MRLSAAIDGEGEDEGLVGNPAVTAWEKPEAPFSERSPCEKILTSPSGSGGAWSYDYRDHSLDDGYYNLRADLVDVAGNIAVSSSLRGFAIDNSGALLPDGTHDPLGDAAIAVTSIVTDSGISDSDFITNATSVTAHGTGAANAWMRVFLDGYHLGDTQVDSSGHWSYGMATPQGGHTISADYIDLAGNVVPGPTASHGMTVDTTAPTLQIQLPAGTAKGAETVYFNFSEGVSGFDASDVTLTNATLSDFKMVDAAHYSATVTPVGHGTGTMSLSVGSNVYTDIAGNGGTGDSESQAYQLGRINLFSNGDFPNLSGWETPAASWSSDNSTLTGGLFADAVDPSNRQGALLFTRDAPPGSTTGGSGAWGAKAQIYLESGKSYEWSMDVKDLKNATLSFFMFLEIHEKVKDDLVVQLGQYSTSNEDIDKAGVSSAFLIQPYWTTIGTKPGTSWKFEGPTAYYDFDFHIYADVGISGGAFVDLPARDVVVDRMFFGEVVV